MRHKNGTAHYRDLDTAGQSRSLNTTIGLVERMVTHRLRRSVQEGKSTAFALKVANRLEEMAKRFRVAHTATV